jgi:hypothetical protein
MQVDMEKFWDKLIDWLALPAIIAVIVLALFALTYVDDVYDAVRRAGGYQTPSVQYQNDLNSNYDPPDCGGRSCGR